MWDMYIERELNAIRLLGKWKVPGPKTYIFEWSKANGTYDSLDSLNQNPKGTVSDETGGRKGTWTIGEELEISWESREYEKWSMPLKPLAQSIFRVPGFATRLSHTLAGKSQIQLFKRRGRYGVRHSNPILLRNSACRRAHRKRHPRKAGANGSSKSRVVATREDSIAR
jgi:hypothetical protein